MVKISKPTFIGYSKLGPPLDYENFKFLYWWKWQWAQLLLKWIYVRPIKDGWKRYFHNVKVGEKFMTPMTAAHLWKNQMIKLSEPVFIGYSQLGPPLDFENLKVLYWSIWRWTQLLWIFVGPIKDGWRRLKNRWEN